MNETTTIARMRPDGVLVRIRLDGTEEVMLVTPLAPMTPEEVEAAAAADPEARPFTAEELAKVRLVPARQDVAPGARPHAGGIC